MRLVRACGRAAAHLIAALALTPTSAGAEDAARWAGFHIGAHFGVSDVRTDGVFDNDAQIALNDFHSTVDARLFDLVSPAMGAHLGHDWARGRFVFGVGLSWTRLGAEDRVRDADAGTVVVGRPDDATVDVNWLLSATVRGGVASSRTLFYVAPGLAWVDARLRARERDSFTPSSGAKDVTGLGAVVGVGFEHALTSRLALRVEARYHLFNVTEDISGLTGASDPGDFVRLKNVLTGTLGVSYRFGGDDGALPETAARWDGFHVGLKAGFGSAMVDSLFDADERSSSVDDDDSVFGRFFDLDGGVFGADFGYAFQRGVWVFGVDASLAAAAISDRAYDPDKDDFPQIDHAETTINLLASLRGKVGRASGRSLFYATGGLGFIDATYRATDADFFVADRGRLRFQEIGYVVGAGFEHRLSGGLSVSVEGLFYGFDARKETSALNIDSDVGDFFDLTGFAVVNVGLRYRFDGDR